MIFSAESIELPDVVSDYRAIWNWLIDSNGLLITLLIVIILIFILKPEIPKSIGVFFLSLFTIFKWARKEVISRSFEQDISKVSSGINKEIGRDILPDNPKIKWVKNQTRESFLKNGKVVVKLDYHDDRNRSFALATASYVNKGLLPFARKYIPNDLIDSFGLLVTRRIITDKNKEALDFFTTEILKDVFVEQPQVKEMYDELSEIDNNAMFMQILLPELWRMGEALFPHNVNLTNVGVEIEKLITFLHTIATKGYDEDAPLSLDGKLFKSRIIIVGKRNILDSRGVRPYINRIEQGIRLGYKTIYLLGYDEKEKNLQVLIDEFRSNEKVSEIVTRKGIVLNKSNFTKMNCISVCLTIDSSETVEREASKELITT